MSVVVVTKNTICADRQTTMGSVISEGAKIFHRAGGKLGEFVAAFTGNLGAAMEVLQWLEGEMKECDYPATQRTEDWCRAVVMDARGHRLCFESGPLSLPVVGEYQAYGDGAAYALGALFVGALPGDAVRSANAHCSSCGFGVEGYTLENGEFTPWSIDCESRT